MSLVDPLLAVTTGSFAAANYVPLFANTESTALPSHRFQPLDFRQQLGNILPGVCNKILISHGSPYQFNVLAARHYEARPTVVISAFDVRFPWSWGCHDAPLAYGIHVEYYGRCVVVCGHGHLQLCLTTALLAQPSSSYERPLRW